MMQIDYFVNKLADGIRKEVDWYMYRRPKNADITRYRGRGRPRRTDYAVYDTLNGNEIVELNK